MFNRYLPWLKWTCLALAGLLAYQVARLVAAEDIPDQSSLGITFTTWSKEGDKLRNQDTGKKDGSTGSTRSGRGAQATLPPEIQSQVDRIQTSGVFGALPRPLPLALLGIGGDDAFVRAPNGQTGLLTVGEELGGIKLLSIGINQVVVEEDGEEKVLSLFPGLGSKTSKSK